MPNEVFFNKELGIVEVKAFGVLLESEMREAVKKILEIREENGVNKILADATKVETPPTTAETFDFWSTYPQGFKQAIVLRESDPAGFDRKFIKDVSANRGRYTRIFDNRASALRWLNNKATAESE